MHKVLKGILIVTILAVLISISLGGSDVQADGIRGTVPGIAAVFDNGDYINANNILMFVNNQGGFGRDLDAVFGYDYGTFYPFTTIEDLEGNISGAGDHSPLYAGGIWIGGQAGGITRIAASEYGSEFWPGPMESGQYIRGADTVAAYRLYKLYADSMGGNPNQDYLEWPVADGAPTDLSGNPLLVGDQTTWSVYNDGNPNEHMTRFGSPSILGVEVQQLSWALDSPGKDEVIFIEYKLFNQGMFDITDCYVSIWIDPDLGGAQDDQVGCDTVSDIIFSYNGDNDDSQYGTQPPAVGVKLVYGPVVSSPGDTARFGSRMIPDFKNLRMSTCQNWVGGADPADVDESYNVMRGLQMNGDPLANGTTFAAPGDPVTGTGDLDPFAGQKILIGSFGPFDFSQGDSQYVFIKVGAGAGVDRLSSLTALKNNLNAPDSIVTGINDRPNKQLPETFTLSQNYPNPFNPSTRFEYSLPSATFVRFEIFNVLGQRIRTLVNTEQSGGTHSTEWDGTDFNGAQVSSGIYFYRVEAGESVQVKKMVLAK